MRLTLGDSKHKRPQLVDVTRAIRPRLAKRAKRRQTERRISNELLLQDKRTVYAIDDTVEHRRLRGATARVREYENGDVALFYNERRLSYRSHPKDTARIAPGSIVDNKRLDAALRFIAGQQAQRDRQRLANRYISVRNKARIRQAALP